MALKLDLKDRKILFELDINSRQPNSTIAKKVGLSKQVVGYRINNLIKEKMISSFYTVIDISKLGFTVHKNFLRLQNLTPEKEKELINYLINNPDVVWVASCDGKYDLAFGTWAKDVTYLDKTLKELDSKYGKFISQREIATIIRGEYFIRDYLINKNKPSESRKSFFGSVPEKVNLDDIDWQILSKISVNSRLMAVEIAQFLGKSADLVADRIKKMEKSGIIKHYNFVPNEEIYLYWHYKILIGLRNITEEKERMLVEFCRVNPNVIYIVKSLGPWEFEVDVEIEDAKKFREFMMNLKGKFNDIIQDYSALHIYKVWKYNFCPSMSED
ncbi:Lrp/AsnC family transcriptional regulator [Candidatus Woesearchaeota archaeon]|nr:Lrp/AsnC family transcriptional regulator [Candidatus Woesearchaeota archaeon]